MAERWDLALIPCTSKKRVGADTAGSLYTGPRFQAMVTHAAQRASRTMIMSAKYGLLDLTDPVQYYDTYLPDLSASDRAALFERLRRKEVVIHLSPDHIRFPTRILSYLPRAYHELLHEAKPAWRMRRPYRDCTMFTILTVLRNEIAHYGTNPSRR